MGYTYTIVESLSGVRRAEVTSVVSDATWATRMHSAGAGKVTLRLRGEAEALHTAGEWRSLTAHWANTLVVSWDGVAVYAGLIADRVWHAGTGELVLSLVELRDMLSWRFTADVAAYNPTLALSISGKSKRGLARALVKEGLNRGGAFNWDFPVVLGADEAGGESIEVFHYEMQLLETLLREVQDSDGGPDVHFEPRWSDEGGLPVGAVFSWHLLLGTPNLPGGLFEFSQSAAKSPVIAPKLVENGRQMTTGVLVAGRGSEHDIVVGKAGYHQPELNLPAVMIPWRDRTIAYKSIDDGPTLDSLGRSELFAHVYPARLKEFSLRIGKDGVPLDQLRIGSRVNVWTKGDEFEGQGWFGGYLAGLSGSTQMQVGLELVTL